jgi:tRNA/rRNA methyltransferase
VFTRKEEIFFFLENQFKKWDRVNSKNLKTVIILEDPKYSGNIGMVCRLIANFDLPNLRIFGEKKELHFEMEWMAHNSEDKLKEIEYYTEFAQATSDIEIIIGTGMIQGKDRGKFIPLSELNSIIEKKSHGIFFGREDRGLRKSTIQLCDYMIDFSLPGSQKSMNLSHSVAYVLGEIYNHSSIIPDQIIDETFLREKKHFYEYAAKILGILGMNNFHGSKNLAVKRLKSILEKRDLNSGDMGFIYKILRNIEELSNNRRDK